MINTQKRHLYTVDPTGMRFLEWSDAMVHVCNGLLFGTHVDSENQWRDWATAVAGQNIVNRFSPPGPENFSTWSEWAVEFNKALSAAGS